MATKSMFRTALTFLLLIVLLVSQIGIPSPRVEAADGKVASSLRAKIAKNPKEKVPIIIEMVGPKTPLRSGLSERRANEAVERLNRLNQDGYAVGGLPIINGAVGFADAEGIEALKRDPSVAFIYEDRLIEPRQGPADADSRDKILPPGLSATLYPRIVKADRVWQTGVTGKGVTVAVLDSGIYPHEDLLYPTNRLLASVNFAGDLAGMPDPGGHGTHVAGIIAGNGTHADLSKRKEDLIGQSRSKPVAYVGIAPDANVVDVRVLNEAGYGRVSSVIRGISWVLENSERYNIRVINLSFGAPASVPYREDPLATAVEIAWMRGLVVVAAAGNSGPDGGTVETPGIDPYVITVGAIDDIGTLPTADDELAWFSSWGTPTLSQPKPDVVAPGRRIVSLRAPGSYLDQLYPDRVVATDSGDGYFRLSGTSMATAVVSGIVALMLERQPDLTPNQVKALLTHTAQPYGQAASPPVDPTADGAGLVNAFAAVNSPPRGEANRGLRPSDGLARALYSLLYGQPLSWKDPHYAGIDWENLAWDNLAWDNLAWDNLAWDNLAWDNLAWDNLAWDNLAWDNLAWDSFENLD